MMSHRWERNAQEADTGRLFGVTWCGSLALGCVGQ